MLIKDKMPKRRKLLVGIFVIVFLLCFGIKLALSWTGISGFAGINTPADNSTVSKYTSVFGWCYETLSDIDYYAVYAAKNTLKDGTLSDTDYQCRIRLIKQEDFNRIEKFNQRLTPRGILKDYTSGDSVVIWINAKRISGELLYTDTAVIGLTGAGDETVPDSCINVFSIK